MPVYRVDCTRRLIIAKEKTVDLIVVGNLGLAVELPKKRHKRRQDEKITTLMRSPDPKVAVKTFIKIYAEILAEHGAVVLLDADMLKNGGAGMMELPECEKLSATKGYLCYDLSKGSPCAALNVELIDTRKYPADCAFCRFNADLADSKKRDKVARIITVERMRIFIPRIKY